MRLMTLRFALLFAGAVALAAYSASMADDDGTSAAEVPPQAARAPAEQPPPLTPPNGDWALPPRRSAPGSEKIDSHLASLFAIETIARADGRSLTAMDAAELPDDLRGAIAARMLRMDRAGRVMVQAALAGDPGAAARELEAAGMRVSRVADDAGIAVGMLPIAELERAAALPGVRFLSLPDVPTLASGSQLTQGDAILDADNLRTLYGVNGSGVRVGVISDGLEGLAAAQGSGDLPSVNSSTCDVVASVPAGEPADATSTGAGAEGTAMLEIVHDMAPGAELWLGYFGMNTSTHGTIADFMAAVDCLAANVDVVVDDIQSFNIGPYDGTSTISQNANTELNRATNRIRGYYTVAGNMALQHYQEPYVDSAPLNSASNLHTFQSTGSTSNQLSLVPRTGDPLYLVSGGSVVVMLQWNDPFASSSNDYDLYLGRTSDATIVAYSVNVQSGSQAPTEYIVYTNTGASQYFEIIIDKWSGSVRTFDLFIPWCDCVPLPGGTWDQPVHNYNTISSSIPNNSDASGGVLSLGAIDAADPGNDTIEPYSSRGGTNDGRVKPDIAAVDGVNVTASGGFFSPFYGTSAAAPHAGAIAALILSCKPSLKQGEPGDSPAADRATLRGALQNTAVDLGSAEPDNTYGYGRLDADAAAANAGCAAPTPTPTSTPTRTSTPTPTATITPTPVADTDGDGVPNASDNCPSASNPGQENTDAGNTAIGFPGADTAGNACDSDDDGDGCTDTEEQGTDQNFGGQRNPLSVWDFYDVNSDQRIDLNDTLDILAHFGHGTADDPLDNLMDRMVPGGAQPWQTVEDTSGNGIDLTDALDNLASFGHDCSAPP